MPKPPTDEEALERLDKRLEALTARTKRKGTGFSDEASGAGYRLVAELVSGILGGLGLGWLVDRYAGTTPFGMVAGLLLGTIASVYLVVKAASRMSDQASKAAPGRPVPFDDEDDDA
jgi:ATP synthase protein I